MPRADKDKVIAGFFYLFPVDLSLKLRDIDSPADSVIVIALVMEPAVIVIFEVLPVVVVEPCVQRKSTQMVFFPGPDIFLLCFCQGIFFILIIFIFILLFVLFLILFLLFVLFFLVLFFFRFFLRFLLLFGGSLFGGVFQLFGFSGVPAVFFSRFVLVSICGFLVLAGFCCVLRSAVFGRFRGFVFGKGFGGIGGGTAE